MSEKKSRKVLYIIFSIVVSIALWTYVVFVGNPMLEEPMEVPNVPIEFVGGDILADNNLIVSDVDVRELTVYFGGRIRDISRISDMEVRAVVDLTDVLRYSTPTGIHALEYDLVYDNSGTNKITVEDVSRSVIEVTVERLVTQNFQIRPIFEGSIAESYVAGALTPSRDTVTVSGTEAAIGKIAMATATLEWENLSSTVNNKEVPIKLLDSSGNEIDAAESGITFVSGDTVLLTQNILMVKDVAFEIDTVHTPTINDSNISITFDPATIRLRGDPEVLEGLNVINLGTVDLKSFYLSYSEDYQIKLPNDTSNLSGFTSVNVTINIKDPNIGVRWLSTANIAYRNSGAGDSVEILNESIPVVIRGPAEVIAQVMEENIRIVADLADYQGLKGGFDVPARAYVDGFPDVDAVGEYTITVYIS